MRFLVDECTGSGVAQWLLAQGHDVFSVCDEARGMKDGDIIQLAQSDCRIIVTNDRGFGAMIFRDGRAHCGAIFLRLRDERTPAKIAALEKLLRFHSRRIEGEFVVVTENQVRFGLQ